MSQATVTDSQLGVSDQFWAFGFGFQKTGVLEGCTGCIQVDSFGWDGSRTLRFFVNPIVEDFAPKCGEIRGHTRCCTPGDPRVSQYIVNLVLTTQQTQQQLVPAFGIVQGSNGRLNQGVHTAPRLRITPAFEDMMRGGETTTERKCLVKSQTKTVTTYSLEGLGPGRTLGTVVNGVHLLNKNSLELTCLQIAESFFNQGIFALEGLPRRGPIQGLTIIP